MVKKYVIDKEAPDGDGRMVYCLQLDLKMSVTSGPQSTSAGQLGFTIGILAFINITKYR